MPKAKLRGSGELVLQDGSLEQTPEYTVAEAAFMAQPRPVDDYEALLFNVGRALIQIKVFDAASATASEEQRQRARRDSRACTNFAAHEIERFKRQHPDITTSAVLLRARLAVEEFQPKDEPRPAAQTIE